MRQGRVGALERDLFPRALRLALVMIDDSGRAVRIARRAVREVIARPAKERVTPHACALDAVRRLALMSSRSVHVASSLDERMARAVSELCDGQGLSHRTAARVLRTSADEVARLHVLAQTAAGVEPAAQPRCCGWSLVRRYDELSPHETSAADAHLVLCRDCAAAHHARLAARGRLRSAVPVGGGVLVGGGVALVAAAVLGGVVATATTLGRLDVDAAVGRPLEAATAASPAEPVVVTTTTAPTTVPARAVAPAPIERVEVEPPPPPVTSIVSDEAGAAALEPAGSPMATDVPADDEPDPPAVDAALDSAPTTAAPTPMSELDAPVPTVVDPAAPADEPSAVDQAAVEPVGAPEPAAEPTAALVPEPTGEPVAEPIVEPVIEPVEPVVEAVVASAVPVVTTVGGLIGLR